MEPPCASCKISAGFRLVDDCYLVCNACGVQMDEFLADFSAEVEMDRDGKSRFGMVSDAARPQFDVHGDIMLDVTLPFERPTRHSAGSAQVTEDTKAASRAGRVAGQIEEALQKLVDPLLTEHAMDVVTRVRRTSEQMFRELFRLDDDQEQVMKNRGFRKKAIYTHIVTRVLLRFIPEYDAKKFMHAVVVPYFQGEDVAVIHKYMQKFGVPMFRRLFEAFDQGFERDFSIHLHCRLRRVLKNLHDHGRYRAVLQADKYAANIFEITGTIVFHPTVTATLQSWDFATRVGVLICALGLSDPDEIVELLDDPIKPATIVQKLRSDLVRDLVANMFTHSDPQIRTMYEQFQSDKAFR